MKIAPFIRDDVFADDAEMVPTRNGFGAGLKAAGDADSQVVALCADLTESTRIQEFAEAFPERYVQIGVAEQNLATVSSGMAAMGKIPFMASYAMFSPGRNWEQIRTTIAYNNQNVKIVGAHAGVSVGPDGATHQAVEDIAIMRVMPNMVVLAPCDAEEAKRATLAAAKYSGPVYIRLGRDKTQVVTTPDAPFEIGRAQVLIDRDPEHKKTVGIIACGTVVPEALRAAKKLNEEGIGASVMNLATIKPLDTKAVEGFAIAHDYVITVEEHQRMGGMGSAVAEHLSLVRPTRIVRLGVDDRFGQSGEPKELIVYYGMDASSIVRTAKENIVK